VVVVVDVVVTEVGTDTVSVIGAIVKKLSAADVYCFIIPVLRPYLLCSLVDVTEENILEALKRPVPCRLLHLIFRALRVFVHHLCFT
jgi:hypothetical protein